MQTEPLLDDVPSFVQDGAHQGEVVTEPNSEFDRFLADAEAEALEGQGVTGTISKEVERMSIGAARALISQGLQGLLGGLAFFLKIRKPVSDYEIDALAKDLAPLVAKYSDKPELLPPWLAKSLAWINENKELLVAAKGLIFFGVSVAIGTKKAIAERDEAEAKAKAEAEGQAAKEQGGDYGKAA